MARRAMEARIIWQASSSSSMSGAQIVHVPYKGSGPAMADLLGGHISFMFDAINTSLPHMKAGRLRALGIGTLKPSRVAPELPTISSQGLPGLRSNTWIGVLAPAGTPREIVHQLNAEIVNVLKMRDIQERLSSQGAEPVGSSPEQFDAFLRSESRSGEGNPRREGSAGGVASRALPAARDKFHRLIFLNRSTAVDLRLFRDLSNRSMRRDSHPTGQKRNDSPKPKHGIYLSDDDIHRAFVSCSNPEPTCGPARPPPECPRA